MEPHPFSPLNVPKENSYYGFARREVVEAIVRLQLPSQRILELGCSNGATARLMKQTLPVDYYEGIELSSEAAKLASETIDRVHVADIAQSAPHTLGLADETFDLVLALDVLEHLYDPWQVLASLTSCIRRGGHVVVSIPNIQNITILDGLSKGKWEYTRAGLLDATHVRFFTLAGIRELLEGAGLQIVDAAYVCNPAPSADSIRDTDNAIRLEHLQLAGLTRQQVMQFFAYQYIVTGRKN